MNKFRERLIELLNNQKLKQTEIAKLIDIPKNRITNWKSGYTEPSLDDLLKVADYFDVSVDYLLGRKDW